MKPTPQEAHDLYLLRGNTSLVGYLERCLTEVQDSLITQQDADLIRVLQGRARTLKEILSLVVEGPKSPRTSTPGKR